MNKINSFTLSLKLFYFIFLNFMCTNDSIVLFKNNFKLTFQYLILSLNLKPIWSISLVIFFYAPNRCHFGSASTSISRISLMFQVF